MKRFSWFLVFAMVLMLSTSVMAQVVEIEFWSVFDYGGPAQSTLEHLIDMFNEQHPNIQVSHSGYSNIWEKMTVSVAGGAPPHVAWGVSGSPALLDEAVLVPMEELAARSQYDTSVFWPALWGDIGATHGVQWGFPFEVGSQALVYNVDEFERAGLAEPPVTWSEYLETAQRLNRPQQGFYGVQPSYESWNTLQVIYRNGADIVSPDGETVLLNDPRTVAALEWYTDLSVRYELVGGWLPSGTAAMHTEHPGWYSMMQETAGFEFGTSAPPIADEGGQRASTSYYKDLGIFRTTPEHEQAAWEFVQWLMAPEQNAIWAVGTAYLPVRRDVLDTELYQHFLMDNPKIIPWIDELNYIRASGIYRDSIMHHLAVATEQVLAGISDAQTALSAVQEPAQAHLDQFREQIGSR